MSEEKLPAMRADPARIRHLTLAIQLEESGSPRLVSLASWLAVAMIGLGVLWAAETEVAQVAQAPGEIVPAGSVQLVQHLEGGIVKAIRVHEGDLVDVGQALVELDRTAALAELDQTRTREAGLRLHAERLRAFAAGRETTLPDLGESELSREQTAILASQIKSQASQRAVLERQLGARRNDLKALETQQKTLERQIQITGEALQMRTKLAEQGLNSRLVLLDIQREMNRVQGELSGVAVNILRAREAVAEAEQRIVELDARLSAEAMRELGTVVAELRQVEEASVRLEDRVARTEIKAPLRGIVKELRTKSEGGVVLPGGTVAEIVPVGQALLAEVRVQPSDVGQIRVGQPVKIKVSTFDFARYGGVGGELVHVSASTFAVPNARPFYKALVKLERDHVGADPKRNLLVPGMTVLADIKTDGRTVLRYLLNPIYRSFDSAFQEK